MHPTPRRATIGSAVIVFTVALVFSFLTTAVPGPDGNAGVHPAEAATAHDPPAGPAPASPARLRIASYNIRHGAGVSGRVDLARTSETLRHIAPDVVFLSEVDQGWRRSGFVDQAAYLARALEMPYTHFAPALSTRSLLFAAPGATARYGNLFLSKLPVLAAGDSPLPRIGQSEPRNVAWIDLELPGGIVRLYGTHLSLVARERVEQLRTLGELLAASPHPSIVLGDFNSPPLRLKSEAPFLWNPPWHDAHLAAGEGEGLTFPAQAPASRIDYVFVHSELLPRLSRSAVYPSDASDHLPVMVELTLSPGS